MSKSTEDINDLRNKIKISVKICDRVLNEFSNLGFIEVKYFKYLENTLSECDRNCLDIYEKVYESNLDNKFFNFKQLRDDISSCTSKCEKIYKHIIDHQIKGSEISYVCKIIIYNENSKLKFIYQLLFNFDLIIIHKFSLLTRNT
jgi:hypothetical protein